MLQLLHRYSPIRGLSPASSTTVNLPPASTLDLFSGMKRDIVIILTQLLHQDKLLQDIIREKGGIELILAQCNIDDNNPCTLLPDEIDN